MKKNRKNFLQAVLTLSLVACAETETQPTPTSTPDSGVVMLVDAGFASSDAGMMDAGTSTVASGMGWNETCSNSSDCSTPTDFCVKQPNEPTGYCTIRCSNNGECTTAGVPSDWTCNTVFTACDGSDLTWCGPNSEISMSGGFVTECP